ADYGERYGITQRPISIKDLRYISVLHSWLRGFGWIIKVLTHLIAGVTRKWSYLSKPEGDMVKSAKRKLQVYIHKKTYIRFDMPSGGTSSTGTSTTGPVVKKLFSSKCRFLLVDLIKERKARNNALKLITNFSNILRIISTTKKIAVDKLEETCKDLRFFFNKTYKNVQFTPTVHKLLAHCANCIRLNDGYGLGFIAEDGLEGNHKELRRAALYHSRKTSAENHQHDIFRRLWIQSDPHIRTLKRNIKLREKKNVKDDEDEIFVKSFIM
ncbi:unnamed protein product, partial [Meganyctiphanes norvegica]